MLAHIAGAMYTWPRPGRLCSSNSCPRGRELALPGRGPAPGSVYNSPRGACQLARRKRSPQGARLLKVTGSRLGSWGHWGPSHALTSGPARLRGESALGRAARHRASSVASSLAMILATSASLPAELA